MAKSRGIGTTISVNNVTVGSCTAINGVEISAEDVDLTALDNASGYREKEPGFKDGGDTTVEGFLDGEDAGQQEMMTLLDSGAVVPVVITFPTKVKATWSFNAGVKGFSTAVGMDGGITFSATLGVSGKPTLTMGGVSAG